MSNPDTGQERSESATPKRRQQAFDEGQVAKSQELTGAIVLLAGTGVLAIGSADGIARSLQTVFGMAEELILASATMSGEHIIEQTGVAGTTALSGVAPTIAAIAVAALTTNLLQARGVVSTHPIKPKLSHISPLSGLKRLFSMQSLFTLVKSVAKLAVLGLVTYGMVRAGWEGVVMLGASAPAEVLDTLSGLALKLAATVGGAYLVLSIADYGFQRYQHEKKLKMTKQEVTQEMKDTEGDPLHKSRLRSLAMNMRRSRMMSDVPKADVVVTNPTRIAVALKYDPASAGAPVVVAMGQRKIAQRIRELAKEAGVPIVENKPLARALLSTARVGEAIPSDLYLAVAEVLAFVFRQGNPAAAGAR